MTQSKTTISDKLIEEVVRFRELNRISLSAMARKAKISKAYLSQLERGTSRKLSFGIAVRLMDVCFINYYKLRYEV